MPDRPVDPRRQPTMIDPLPAATGSSAPPDPGAEAGADVRAGAGPDEAPVVVGGRYELRELLGAGGMCDVWRAHDPVLEREVAVKRLLRHFRDDARVRERFAAEALRVAKLTHPGIIGVLDAGEDAAGPFLVMELVDGPTLAEHLVLAGRLSGDEVVSIGLAVARGLGAAHRAGIVHRDVKPGNILLDPRHGARLTDFGIAKAAADVDMTATGEVLGTAAYLAPEQAMGHPVDARSDVYSLGCVLFECLTGMRPFGGDTPVQVASARIGAQVRVSDRLPDVPPHLDDVIATAMAPDPDDRWSDGDAIARALASGVREGWTPSSAPILPSVAATQRLPAAEAAVLGAAMAAEEAGAPLERVGHDPSGEGWGPDVQRRAAPVGGRRPPGAPLVVLAVVVLLGLAALALSRMGAAEDGGEAPDGEVAESATPSPDGAPVVDIALASFDPFGGDGENDDELGLLVDGDPATQWTTVGYDSAAFGNLKPGVGVLLDLGAPTAIVEVQLSGLPPGQVVELRAAESQPATLDDTSVVSTATALEADGVLRPDTPATTRWLVIWLTGDLPTDGGRYRGAIGEVTVIGG